MKKIVVSGLRGLPFELPDVPVITSREYLTSREWAEASEVHLVNLSSEYRYRSRGYYVSLLAEARGHRVLPSVKTIQDLKTATLTQIVSDELDTLIARSLRRLKGSTFELSVYFGRNLAKRYDPLARELFRLFQAPLLRARFVRDRAWEIKSVRALSLSEVPAEHVDFLGDVAQAYFARRRYHRSRPDRFIYDLAILHDPDEATPPSDAAALDKFVQAGERHGFSVELVTRDDYARIGEFDALLIRATTSVDHHTYRFARRAQSEGLAVIDDPDSILRCTNKVYLAELLQRARIPMPKTVIVHADNRKEVPEELGLPCVLKLPDASSSIGVVKVETREAFEAELDGMLDASDLVIAQAYMPTDFDWRIGVLDGQALYACKYFMARGHWQIYNWSACTSRETYGDWETLPLEEAPAHVVETALKAARLIGDGLYGVDVKEIDGQAYLIEVNDNPSIDYGVEDAVLQDELYTRIIQALKHRLEQKREIKHAS